MKKIVAVSSFLSRNLTLVIIFTTLIALVIPEIFLPVAGIKIYNLSVPNLLLAVIMFGTGMSIKFKDIIEIFKRPRNVLLGVTGKFIFMALGGYLVAKVLGLDNQLAFGLVLLGTMPPGTAASVIVLIAGGEVAFAVAITVISTLIAPVLTPVLTFLLGGEWVQIDFISMFLNIVIVVLIPVILGMIVRSIFKDKCDTYKSVVGLISTRSLILIVAVSTAPNKSVILSISSIIVILAVTLCFFIAVIGAFLLAKVLKLNRKQTLALLVVSSEQNSGLSVGIAAAFSDIYPMAAIPSIIAVSLNVTLATALANILGNREKKHVKKNLDAVSHHSGAPRRT